MQINIHTKHYYKPTSKRIRQIGDTLLWTFSTITAVSAYMDIKWLSITALLCGILGKALTNMLPNDKDTKDIDNSTSNI